jgi:pimeloyl-ACP methyl ester carboxylesterase
VGGRRRRIFTGAVFAALAASSVVWTGGGAGAAPPPVGVRWSPCHRDFGPFECATVQVPLDYDDPRSGRISLALIRLPASGEAGERIGSLFVNPGGPGGSGFDLVLFAGQSLFPAEIGERFDIVGFDPRGVARSTGLRCFGNFRQLAQSVFTTGLPFPLTEEEEALWIAGERAFDESCARRHLRLADHISTANVARDLDQLRAAVGDEQLTYYGVSYGSFLGTTYANLFPHRVRAVGIDSVLDPIVWANEGGSVPFSTLLRSDASALATLGEFFRLCDDNPAGCAFAPDSEARFAALAERLLAGPILIEDPEFGTFEYLYHYLIGDALGAMYDSFSWPFFADFLALLESQPDAATLGLARAELRARILEGYDTKRGFPRYPNFLEGFTATACNDTAGPSGYDAWIAAADAADAEFGYFGRLWTWASSICAEWPFDDADRYPGPFNAATAHPILVVGNRFDPATRYEGAVLVADLLPNSALLTLDAWGHGSIGLSTCADEIIVDYLLQVAVPPEGTVCQQDFTPFADPLPF